MVIKKKKKNRDWLITQNDSFSKNWGAEKSWENFCEISKML
jgi:hypothetical protein